MSGTGWAVLSLVLGGVAMTLVAVAAWPRRHGFYFASSFFVAAEMIAIIEAWRA